jgi:hypothetical protein
MRPLHEQAKMMESSIEKTLDPRAQRCIDRLQSEIAYYAMRINEETVSRVQMDECLQSIEVCKIAICIIREEFNRGT